ncbi:hypothetical protein CC2G_004490 [Coprinopsis cinerea AmutBmut pab1-1]|nr:hypothetical protein CC2G_004490 [Coprinopsis cinerea AmutBmut pab1-1]
MGVPESKQVSKTDLRAPSWLIRASVEIADTRLERGFAKDYQPHNPTKDIRLIDPNGRTINLSLVSHHPPHQHSASCIASC